MTVIQPKVESYYREKSYLEATNPERVGVLGPDMERIRERQQEEHERKVAEAKEVAERKRVEEMRRKRIEDPNNKKGGRKLGGGTDGNATKDATKSAVNPTGRGSCNALNPSTGNASGYRPARRNPNNRS